MKFSLLFKTVSSSSPSASITPSIEDFDIESNVMLCLGIPNIKDLRQLTVNQRDEFLDHLKTPTSTEPCHFNIKEIQRVGFLVEIKKGGPGLKGEASAMRHIMLMHPVSGKKLFLGTFKSGHSTASYPRNIELLLKDAERKGIFLDELADRLTRETLAEPLKAESAITPKPVPKTDPNLILKEIQQRWTERPKALSPGKLYEGIRDYLRLAACAPDARTAVRERIVEFMASSLSDGSYDFGLSNQLGDPKLVVLHKDGTVTTYPLDAFILEDQAKELSVLRQAIKGKLLPQNTEKTLAFQWLSLDFEAESFDATPLEFLRAKRALYQQVVAQLEQAPKALIQSFLRSNAFLPELLLSDQGSGFLNTCLSQELYFQDCKPEQKPTFMKMIKTQFQAERLLNLIGHNHDRDSILLFLQQEPRFFREKCACILTYFSQDKAILTALKTTLEMMDESQRPSAFYALPHSHREKLLALTGFSFKLPQNDTEKRDADSSAKIHRNKRKKLAAKETEPSQLNLESSVRLFALKMATEFKIDTAALRYIAFQSDGEAKLQQALDPIYCAWTAENIPREHMDCLVKLFQHCASEGISALPDTERLNHYLGISLDTNKPMGIPFWVMNGADPCSVSPKGQYVTDFQLRTNNYKKEIYDEGYDDLLCRIVTICLFEGMPVDFRGENPRGRATMLHFAVEYGLINLTQLLLKHGANPNLPKQELTCMAQNPLDIAIRRENEPIAALLRAHGAYARVGEFTCITDLFPSLLTLKMTTATESLTKQERLGLALTHLSQTVDLENKRNVVDPCYWPIEVLLIGAFRADLPYLPPLLENLSRQSTKLVLMPEDLTYIYSRQEDFDKFLSFFDSKALNRVNFSAMHVAAGLGFINTYLLYAKRANQEGDQVPDSAGRFELHHAVLGAIGASDEAFEDFTRIIRASVSERNTDINQPVQLSFKLPQHDEVMKFKGPNINFLEKLPVSFTKPEHVEDSRYKTVTGDTVVHLAARAGNLRLLQFLAEEMGADISLTNSEGKRPFQLCEPRSEAQRYLVSRVVKGATPPTPSTATTPSAVTTPPNEEAAPSIPVADKSVYVPMPDERPAKKLQPDHRIETTLTLLRVFSVLGVLSAMLFLLSFQISSESDS